LGRAERLHDIVVGAGVEHLHDALLGIPGGRHDHRNRRHRPQHPENLGPVDVRQPEIEDDQVRPVGDGLGQPVHAGRGGGDRVPAVGQAADQRRPDGRVVLDQQKLSHPPNLTPQLPACRIARDALSPS
jgi:hypothetical protein